MSKPTKFSAWGRMFVVLAWSVTNAPSHFIQDLIYPGFICCDLFVVEVKANVEDGVLRLKQVRKQLLYFIDLNLPDTIPIRPSGDNHHGCFLYLA